MKLERRFVKGAQVRAKKGDTPAIEGYGAVFGQDYVLYEDSKYRIVERITPGAFQRVLQEKQDTRCLFNHDADNVLGRSTNNTLRMNEDSDGLHFENDLDLRTTVGQNVQAFVDRGDVSGCSFAFTVSKQTWRDEKGSDGKQVSTREIDEIDQLYDVGPVTYPAYTGTSVAARSEMRSAVMAIEGLPVTLRHALAIARAADGQECSCQCRACYGGDHEECEMCMVNCGDEENCDHTMQDDGDRAGRGDSKPTKRVDSEDLTSDCFVYVGDPQKPATWALPWKFKTTAKIKSHLRNALARFNQTKKIPTDKKADAWKKLVNLCKKYGVKVSDQEAKAWGLTPEQRDQIGAGTRCQCDCPECQVGDCAHCSDADCTDPGCNHDGADGGAADQDDDDRAADLVEVDARLRRSGFALIK